MRYHNRLLERPQSKNAKHAQCHRRRRPGRCNASVKASQQCDPTQKPEETNKVRPTDNIRLTGGNHVQDHPSAVSTPNLVVHMHGYPTWTKTEFTPLLKAVADNPNITPHNCRPWDLHGPFRFLLISNCCHSPPPRPPRPSLPLRPLPLLV